MLKYIKEKNHNNYYLFFCLSIYTSDKVHFVRISFKCEQADAREKYYYYYYFRCCVSFFAIALLASSLVVWLTIIFRRRHFIFIQISNFIIY